MAMTLRRCQFTLSLMPMEFLLTPLLGTELEVETIGFVLSLDRIDRVKWTSSSMERRTMFMSSDNPPRRFPKMFPEMRLWRRLVPEIRTILDKSIVIEIRSSNIPQISVMMGRTKIILQY